MTTDAVSDDADETAYTPAGDVDAVIAALDGVDVDGGEHPATATDVPDANDTEGDSTVDPAVEAAFDALVDSLADATDPATAAAADAVDALGGDEPDASGGTGVAAARERADFDEVAESTDVDAVPFEDAATFLANPLYAVPPANTRFQWADPPDPTPDWELPNAS
jgi:hypothetical protein